MRTRVLNELTNYEVEQYLERNDLIFIPVGTIELHGSMPLNVEYIGAEGVAREMAEQADGLVLTGLQCFFPGGTAIGKGTIHVSTKDGQAYLYSIAKSLLRQGFRRQVYVSLHGPSHMTISPMIKNIFEDFRVPLLYIDLTQAMQRIAPKLIKMNPKLNDEQGMGGETLFFGAYSMLGQENVIPLDLGIGTVPSTFSKIHQLIPKLNWAPISGFSSFYYGELADHGSIAPMTAEERHEKCLLGEKFIKDIVAEMDICGVVDALKELDQYHQEYIYPKYPWLP